MGERRLAEDDTVIRVEQDGTFCPGRIPKQNTLGQHRQKQRCHDRASEDLCGDPLYRQILVNIYPNEDTTDVLPHQLALIDRNLKVGQLVKQGQHRVGYVRSLRQTASGRIYDSDPASRNDPARELYLYNKPAEFFSENLWEVGQAVCLSGWIGIIEKISSFVTIEVEFVDNGNKAKAIMTQEELFLIMAAANVDGLDTKRKADGSTNFQINGIDGMFETRSFIAPYSIFHKTKWSDPKPALTPEENSIERVKVTVVSVRLHMITVDWKRAVIPNAPKPGKTVKNDDTRSQLKLASHAPGMKIGDIRYCKMGVEDWKNVFAKHCWQNTISKDYFLHKRRNKRPRVDEGSVEILPAEPRPTRIAVEILTTATKAEVEWIGGLVVEDIDSRDLIPVRFKIHFPGTLLRQHARTNERPMPGLGPLLTVAMSYKVVQRTEVKPRLGRPPLYRHTVQSFTIPAGGLEPAANGGTEIETGTLTLKEQFRFWDKGNCQVVCKMPNSTANFEYGCVIGAFPNGRITIRVVQNEQPEFLSVWPTDLVAVHLPPEIIDRRMNHWDF